MHLTKSLALRAIAGGLHQVVLFGAGYDGRALRFRAPGTWTRATPGNLHAAVLVHG